VESTAQTAVLETAMGKVGAAMRTGPTEEAVASVVVAEHHKVFAQKLDRLDRPLPAQFIDQRRRLPIAPQRLPCGLTRTNTGHAIILFRAEHDDLRKSYAYGINGPFTTDDRCSTR
jgi:hypothetical protein